MCMQVVVGSAKYLSCGHITNGRAHQQACASSTCLTSPNHVLPCSRGTKRGCGACTPAQACNAHHTCVAYQRFEEKIDRMIPGFCNACAPQ